MIWFDETVILLITHEGAQGILLSYGHFWSLCAYWLLDFLISGEHGFMVYTTQGGLCAECGFL